ncbi:hypothetical protein C8J57DRAFT_1240604 [Mycena rebaudengoi]|nr:hypothetical protein C8J57DRAFT_1240604 [Mycena rebaudengoi]
MRLNFAVELVGGIKIWDTKSKSDAKSCTRPRVDIQLAAQLDAYLNVPTSPISSWACITSVVIREVQLAQVDEVNEGSYGGVLAIDSQLKKASTLALMPGQQAARVYCVYCKFLQSHVRNMCLIIVYVAARDISLIADSAGSISTPQHQTTVLEFPVRRSLSDTADWNGRVYRYACDMIHKLIIRSGAANRISECLHNVVTTVQWIQDLSLPIPHLLPLTPHFTVIVKTMDPTEHSAPDTRNTSGPDGARSTGTFAVIQDVYYNRVSGILQRDWARLTIMLEGIETTAFGFR